MCVCLQASSMYCVLCTAAVSLNSRSALVCCQDLHHASTSSNHSTQCKQRNQFSDTGQCGSRGIANVRLGKGREKEQLVLLQVGDHSSAYLIPVGESTVVFIATGTH